MGTSAQIGTEGPAVIHNSIIGAEAEVSSGFLSDSTLLPRAKVGANAHFRGGTLLEEYATTAHCVGLKQSILMYSVTLGSLINFCDVLISGGAPARSTRRWGADLFILILLPGEKMGIRQPPPWWEMLRMAFSWIRSVFFWAAYPEWWGPHRLDLEQ